MDCEKATHSGESVTLYDAIGIDMLFSKEVHIEGVHFSGLKNGALILRTAWDARIINCTFWNCGSGSIPATLLTQDSTRGSNTNSCKFIGCRWENHLEGALATQVEIKAPSRQNFFDSCKFHGDEDNTNPLIYIHDDKWNRNFFVNCAIGWNGAELIKIENATDHPTTLEACLIQSWGYYDSDKPYVNLIDMSKGYIKLVGCMLIGGDKGIYAADDGSMNPSYVEVNATRFYGHKTTAIELVNSDIHASGQLRISDCGKHAIVITPRWHSIISGLHIINTDLDGLSTPAIWVKSGGLKILSDVWITNVDVGYQFDATPEIAKNINIRGKKFENSGTATIASGATSVTVDHGLVSAPSKVLVTPRGNIGSIWVSNVTDTQFTINCSNAPTEDVQVDWYAEV